MSTLTENVFCESFAQCEHDKYVAAIQSLLFLGNISTALNDNSVTEVGDIFPELRSSQCHGDEKEKNERASKHEKLLPQKILKRPAEYNKIVCPVRKANSSSCSDEMSDDLSNALISSSLVLASVSKTKKRISPASCDSSNKRRRIVVSSESPLETSAATLTSSVKCSASEKGVGNKIYVNKNMLSSTQKTTKSSSDRYRERNSRRKHFFENKLGKVVELLKQYRLRILLKVK
jgi:hypothetical protein